jgi:uncharacterized protein YecE (DUF72 family)
MKAIKWHIGCSGFHYREWKNKFYPEKLSPKKWFEFYSTQFNTLELNVTFYRFPQWAVLEGWHERSPSDFSFDFYDTVQKGYPALPDKAVVNGTVAYYRFHGVPELYYSAYPNLFLKKWRIVC